jgi:hypothetical protein
VGINVSLSFLEPMHGNGRFLLRRPLENSLHDATVLLLKNENEEVLKKTVAVMQGITTQRDGDNVHYKARLSVSPDHLGTVEENVRAALQGLMQRFRAGFSGVTVDVEPNPRPGVELNHETPDRDLEQREDNGGPLRAEVSQA